MVFSVYEVIRVASQSRSWFVYSPRETSAAQGVNKPATRQTSHASDFENAKGHPRGKPLLAG